MKTGVMHMSARGPTLSRPGKRPEDLPLLFSHIPAAGPFFLGPCGEKTRRPPCSLLPSICLGGGHINEPGDCVQRTAHFTTQPSPSDQAFFACVCQRRGQGGARKEEQGRSKNCPGHCITNQRPRPTTWSPPRLDLPCSPFHPPPHHRHNPQHLEEGEGVAYAGVAGCLKAEFGRAARDRKQHKRKAKTRTTTSARGPPRAPCPATSVMPLFLKKKEAPTSRIFHVSLAPAPPSSFLPVPVGHDGMPSCMPPELGQTTCMQRWEG